MKIFTGQSLRTLLNTPTAHSLLATFGQCGWTDGGCAILADALLTFLPGSMPVLVVSENGAEHVAVRWDGLIWDADGASMDRVMIKLWRTVEHIPSAVLEDGSVETMALRGAPRDPSVSGKLVLMLAHRFCKDLD